MRIEHDSAAMLSLYLDQDEMLGLVRWGLQLTQVPPAIVEVAGDPSVTLGVVGPAGDDDEWVIELLLDPPPSPGWHRYDHLGCCRQPADAPVHTSPVGTVTEWEG